MINVLNDFLATFFYGYFMIFVRFGTAMVIMPGIGDSFVSPRIRLLFALGLSLVVAPVLQSYIAPPPESVFQLSFYIMKEGLIGFFIGLVGRIMVSTLSTAGMMIALQSGLASAIVFNPGQNAQGSVIGVFLTIVAVTLIFATNLHHLLLLTVFESYTLFQFATIGDMGDLANAVARIFADSFRIGVQFSVPFILASFMLYITLGILARLMPQLQIFFLALPAQVFLGLVILFLTLSVAMFYWLGEFENTLVELLAQ